MTEPGKRRLRAVLKLLVYFDEKKMPQATAIILGVAGVGIGLLFLFRSARFLASPALQVAFAAAPPMFWGVTFLSVGVSLASVSIVAYRSSYALCGILSFVLVAFAGLSAAGVVGGYGTGLLAWLCLSLGAICSLNAISIYAPRLRGLVI